MDTENQLLDTYRPITEADIVTARNYVRRRESAAHGLSSLIDALLKDAAAEITQICYRHGVDPQRFTLTSEYNGKMFEEVASVLDRMEDEILDLVLDYSTRCTESKKRRSLLLPWILSLGRGNRNLQQTLHARIRMFVGDMEAVIPSMVQAKVPLASAVTKIRSGLHAIYTIPEVRAAFSRSVRMQAQNIRTKGAKKGNVGNSSSEANNIIRFGEITLQMSWMRNQLMNYEERGAAGYYVFRGSSYPCALCDSKTGFHPVTDISEVIPAHGHCMCFAVPVFMNDND